MNAAEVAYARLLLVERSAEGAFGLRLLARIEAAWRARQAEREQARACNNAHLGEPELLSIKQEARNSAESALCEAFRTAKSP